MIWIMTSLMHVSAIKPIEVWLVKISTLGFEHVSYTDDYCNVIHVVIPEELAQCYVGTLWWVMGSPIHEAIGRPKNMINCEITAR